MVDFALWILTLAAFLDDRCALGFRCVPRVVENRTDLRVSVPVATYDTSLVEVHRPEGVYRPEASQKQPIRIELLFVRHGHGCHNALNYQTAWQWKIAVPVPIGSIYHCKTPDPLLTDCGLIKSRESGIELHEQLATRNWRPDFVGSSSMLRAMETAMAMFPAETVFPLPFISEEGGLPCNNPLPLSEQQAVLDRRSVDWRYVTGDVSLNDTRIRDGYHSHKRHWSIDEARAAVKYKEFRAFLGEQVVPHLLDRSTDAQSGGRIMRIAIVSHSKFLRDRFAKMFRCPTYFVNNAAKMVYYDFDPATRMLTEDVRENNETCTAILDSPAHLWKEKYLCAKDYARCFADASMKRPGWAPRGDAVNPFIKSPKEGQPCCV